MSRFKEAMSILFGKKPSNTRYADMLNGYTPIFTQFGQNIYASDVVQQALNCIVSEMKKLNPMHVRTNGMDETPVTGSGSLQSVLENPNELMTKSEFIEKIMWNLLFNYNSFIVPTYYVWYDENTKTEKRIYKALYPVQPVQVDFIQDASDTLYIKMRFANNYEVTLPYSEVIHIKHKFSVNEYMGGNERGQPDNEALIKTLELNHILLQGVSSAMKASCAINGVVKYNTMMDEGKAKAAIKEFEKKIQNSESGIIGLDLKQEYTPIKKDIKLVDADTLKFIDEKILRNWGISLPILVGDYNKEQYEAFYQKVLEPFIISFSQAFTKTLFTDRERAFGNEIKFYPKDLIFMSVNQTLEMIRLLGDSGALYENEKRVALGLKPDPALEGVRKQSLNYVDIAIANQYQVGSSGDNTNNQDGNQSDINDEVKDAALNGAQVTALISVIEQFKNGTLTEEQAINIIVISFGLSTEDATKMVKGNEEIEED